MAIFFKLNSLLGLFNHIVSLVVANEPMFRWLIGAQKVENHRPSDSTAAE